MPHLHAQIGHPRRAESDALLTELDAVSATLDTAALQKTYGTDRVAFLYFLPVSGASFTMVH